MKSLPKLLIFAALGILSVGFAQGAPKSDSKHKASHPATAASAVTISISKDSISKGPAAFGANPLQIKVGTQVTWVNEDSIAHTTTSDSGDWDSGNILPGKSFSRRFDQPGNYSYYCALHGKASMSGVIEVK